MVRPFSFDFWSAHLKHNRNRHHMRAAHHEAGHAVAVLLLDMGLEYATIEGYSLSVDEIRRLLIKGDDRT